MKAALLSEEQRVRTRALKLTCIVLVVCIPFAATAIGGGRQVDSKMSADENRILLLENAWNSAEQQKNTRALDELLSSSLAYTDYDGSFMTKAEFLASVAAPSLHPEQIVNESVTVHSYGSSAVVTGIYREKGTANGKAYLRRGRFTDTWVSEDGVWRCVASQSTLISR